ncbi:MAG: diguanylate cyclase [Candidatus Aminicenantes bacterium]|nr:diguanylate cyclase [Candidatus Aminicenantes bacterium]
MFKKYLLYALIIFAFSLSSFAQELPVIHYGTKEGLPSVFIVSLSQDEDNRIWISHHTGISVYDGSHFQNWSREDGLLANTPSTVMADGKGTVWVLFAGRGIQYMDKNGSLYTVPDPEDIFKQDRIPFLYKLNNGSILATGGKGYYKITKEKIDGPFYPVQGKNNRVIYVLDLQSNRGLLISTADGVFLIRENTASLLSLPYEKIGSRAISVMAEGREGEIFLASRTGWLIRRRNGKPETWDLKNHTENRPISFFEMRCDSRGRVWIATGSGLFLWEEGEISRFTEDHGLSNIWLNGLLVGKQGVLWIATESGLDKISRFEFRNYVYRRDFPVNAVWCLESLPDGNIWAGTNKGIIAFSLEGDYKIISRKDGLPEEAIIRLEAEKNGRVWILSYGGIHCWNGRKFISYPYRPFDIINLWGLLVVNPREIWIFTSDGIFILDPQNKTFHKPALNDRISDVNALNNIVLTKNGEIFSVGHTIHRIGKDRSIEKIELPDWGRQISIFNLVEDGSLIWLVTDEGLISFDGRNWQRFPVSSIKIFDMIKLADNDYWLGCSSGVAHFNGRNFNFYGFHDGIAVEECNTNAILRDSRGRIWVGGKNISIINPSALRVLPPCIPIITRTLAGDKEDILPESIQIPSNSRSLEIEFSTPCFINEQEIRHRYRMADIESDWSETTEHSVRYARLSPGNHFFEVQSRQKNEDWKGPPSNLTINVSPRFWQTIWARILYVLLFVAAGFLINIVRLRALEKQRKKLKYLVDTQTKEIRKQRDLLAQLATMDALTNLPNRRKFIESFEKELRRSKRNLQPLSLCIFDIDFFKKVNDTFGHSMGDEVLKLVADRGIKAIRNTDTFARWGGDEFVFLMPETDKRQAKETCHRLKNAIQSEPLSLSLFEKITFTLSGGISTWNPIKDRQKTSDEIFKEADEILYKAKNSGRDNILQ